MHELELQKWERELDCFSKIKSAIILEGNIYDGYQYPVRSPEGKVTLRPKPNLESYLDAFLGENGYEIIVFFDIVDGLHASRPGQLEAFEKLIKVEEKYQGRTDRPPEYFTALEDIRTSLLNGTAPKGKGGARNHTFAQMADLARTALGNRGISTAIVFSMASRCLLNPSSLTEAERNAYAKLFKASLQPTIIHRDRNGADSKLTNLMILVADKVNDVPAWFYLNNSNVKTVHLSKPSFEERRAYMKRMLSRIDGQGAIDPSAYVRIEDDLSNATDGFSTSDLMSLTRLIDTNMLSQKDYNLEKIKELITLYKYGISENPWDNMGREVVERVEKEIETNVMGQDSACQKVIDIIKRSMTGMSGMQHGSGTKPKGVMFFAGPTGTGKTQTAKALAKGLFGDEARCVRFDMSEYAQSHSDQKLFGAPPGYVGYEAGGQLTNVMREKPFSVLLFDEIEKASPSILDKFLQVLEDGRMTDGQGNTVYFTDSIIIFTSNLGMTASANVHYEQLPVQASMSYAQVNDRLQQNIKNFFKQGIGRPELLNRFGDNIIVFDYIRAAAAQSIFDMQLANIRERLHKSRNIDLRLSPEAALQLQERIGITAAEVSQSGLENGGRGVGNTIESHLINPVARYIFDHAVRNACLVVERIEETESMVEVVCRVSPQTDG